MSALTRSISPGAIRNRTKKEPNRAAPCSAREPSREPGGLAHGESDVERAEGDLFEDEILFRVRSRLYQRK